MLFRSWVGVIPIYSILCWVSLIQMLSSTSAWLFQAQGRTDQTFVYSLLNFGVLLAAIYLGAQQGTVAAVAWAYLAAQFVLLYPMLEMPGRLVGLHFMEVMRVVLPNLARALGMGLAVHAVHVLLVPESWRPILQLALLVPIGITTYIVIAVLTPGEPYAEIRRFLQSRRAARVGATSAGEG